MKMAQWIATSCLFLTLAVPAPAGAVLQVPGKFNVQGMLRNGDGGVVPDTVTNALGQVVAATYVLRFRLYADGTTAVPFWETTKSVSPKSGVFATELPIDLVDASVDWTHRSGAYLEMAVVEDLGPRVIWKRPVLSVPFAGGARYVELATSATEAASGVSLSGAATGLVCDGCVTGDEISTIPGLQIQNVNLKSGSVDSSKILDGTILFSDLAMPCGAGSNGKVVKAISDSPYWSCGDDGKNGGTISSISAGAGIAITVGGSPASAITETGTLSIPDGGVTNTMLASDKITIALPTVVPPSVTGLVVGNGGQATLGGSAVSIDLSTLVPEHGGFGISTQCEADGKILKVDSGGNWGCQDDSYGAGTVTNGITAATPLAWSWSGDSTVGYAGTLSLGVMPVSMGGTGLGTLDSHYIYKGSNVSTTAPMVRTSIYTDDDGINTAGLGTGIGTPTTSAARLTVSGNPALYLNANNGSAPDLTFGATGDKISIGTSSSAATGGIVFYNTATASGGASTVPSTGGVVFNPGNGTITIRSTNPDYNPLSNTDVSLRNSQFETLTFATGLNEGTCSALPFVPFAFPNPNWADGTLELEIIKPSSAAGWSGSLIATFTCRPPSGGGATSDGSELCHADIHNGGAAAANLGAGFVAAYLNDYTNHQLVIWLRTNTTYYFRSNQQAGYATAPSRFSITPCATYATAVVTDPLAVNITGGRVYAGGAANTASSTVAQQTFRLTNNLVVNASSSSSDYGSLWTGQRADDQYDGPDDVPGNSALINKEMVDFGAQWSDKVGIIAYGTARKTDFTLNTPRAASEVIKPYSGKTIRVDANPLDSAGTGFMVSNDGGFFKGVAASSVPTFDGASPTKTGNFITFAGSTGLDMGGKGLKRGCPRGWRTYKSDGGSSHADLTSYGFCMSPGKLSGTMSEGPNTCATTYAGSRMCNPEEIRAAIYAVGDGPVSDAWFWLFGNVWMNDNDDAANGFVVSPPTQSWYSAWGYSWVAAGTRSNPTMASQGATATNYVKCCYPL